MFRRLFLVLILFVVALGNVQPARGQAAGAISVLGRDGNPKSKITDGDGIQLRLTLSAKAAAAAPVEFHLAGFDPAVTTCTVNVGADTCQSDLFPALGWYWQPGGIPAPQRQITALVNGQPFPGVTTLEIAPRPVVLVHGFISNWETWKTYLGAGGYLSELGLQGFAVGDGQAPGVLNTGSPTNSSGQTNSIAQNAVILRDYIAAVQQKTGAERVDLLVHSMGGMISRYYIDRVMQTNNVAQVIFLGTPQAGSACVYPVAALGFLFPASIEIQPAYMESIFNLQIVHRHGIPFHLVAGTRLLEPVASPCTNVPSDTVVGFDSATAIPLDSVDKIPMIHGDLTVNRLVFDGAVKALLQAGPEAFAPRPDPPAPAVQSAPEQFSRTFTGHVNPGASQQITIQIDPNVTLANFSLYDSSHSLTTEVRGASGNLITLDPQKNGVLKVDDPATMIYLGYGFNNPKPGAWVVKVMATDKTPAAGADFALNARYLGGATLTAQTSPTIPAFGQAVNISARLTVDGQSVTVDSAQALIRKPDGSQETVQLAQTGDVFLTDYKPAASGLYAVSVLVTGKTAQGNAIDRAAHLSFEVQRSMSEVEQSQASMLANGILFVVGLFLAGLAGLVVLILLIRWLRRR